MLIRGLRTKQYRATWEKLPLGCVCCQNGKLKPLSGQANTSYVRKRKKIDFSLDSGDDSDEWDDGKKGKKGKGKGANGKRAGKVCVKSRYLNSTRTR